MGIDAHIRWLVRADLEEVQRIEEASFAEYWTERDFLNTLRNNQNVALTASSVRFGHVLGYVVYGLHKRRYEILNLAVAPAAQRYGVGRQLLEKLQSKLAPERRFKIATNVRETNLRGQQFFRACGFRAVEVLRDHYDGGEAAYRFEYLLPELLAELRASGQVSSGR